MFLYSEQTQQSCKNNFPPSILNRNTTTGISVIFYSFHFSLNMMHFIRCWHTVSVIGQEPRRQKDVAIRLATAFRNHTNNKNEGNPLINNTGDLAELILLSLFTPSPRHNMQIITRCEHVVVISFTSLKKLCAPSPLLTVASVSRPASLLKFATNDPYPYFLHLRSGETLPPSPRTSVFTYLASLTTKLFLQREAHPTPVMEYVRSSPCAASSP